MKTFNAVVAFATVFVVCTGVATAQQDAGEACHRVAENRVEGGVDARLCIGYLTDQLATLQEQLATRPPEVFRDSVIAFLQDQCPPGWRNVPEVAGRFVLAADGDEYPYEAIGGEERVTLTPDELPPVESTIVEDNDAFTFDARIANVVPCLDNGCLQQPAVTSGFRSGTTNETFRIVSEGGSRAHNNIPPYIALTFCRPDLR